MDDNFLNRIKERKEKLEEVNILLKEKFIGIDDVIDKIIDNISLWYLTPEIQFKPLIISLWGITGVGKTDLVRTLVKHLNFGDKFIEIQMDNKNEYQKTIESYLDNSGVDSTEPSILLLDEIQRYRTINETGHMIDNKYFNDIWMLLSDGKLQSNSQRKMDIMEMLFEEIYWEDQRNDEEEDEVAEGNGDDSPKNVTLGQPVEEKKKKKKKDYRFKTSYWSAKRMQKKLGLKIPVQEIMEMSSEDRVEMLEKHLKEDNINEGKSYEKLLIFVSGNLDEAFRMADEVEDNERDADIYHEMSKRITILHIKEALLKKFKPEQIARFGNNHIIYPCLDKKSYETIIKMNCQMVLDRIQNEHKINITLGEEIYSAIYRNGVFPTQGVRPAISTAFNVLSSNLPYFIYHCLIGKVNKFHLNLKDGRLFSTINKERYEKELILDIDVIKKNRSIDEKMLITVHELGHALVYGLLFNTAPKQININSSSVFSSGFVITHNSIDNKTYLRNQIAVFLAGLVAEEVVFGDEYKSNGAHQDIMAATSTAGSYVRAYGMDGYVSRVVKITADMHGEFNYDTDESNKIIENILKEEKTRTQELIKKNSGLLKILISFTQNTNSINSEDFIRICNENGLNLVHKEMSDKITYSYNEKLLRFLKE